MDAKEIQTLISGYGLMDTLEDTLQIAVKGGVARSTIYAAFRLGPTTKRNQIVLNIAKQLIAQHENMVAEAVLAVRHC